MCILRCGCSYFTTKSPNEIPGPLIFLPCGSYWYAKSWGIKLYIHLLFMNFTSQSPIFSSFWLQNSAHRALKWHTV